MLSQSCLLSSRKNCFFCQYLDHCVVTVLTGELKNLKEILSVENKPFIQRRNKLSVQSDCLVFGSRSVAPLKTQSKLLSLLHFSSRYCCNGINGIVLANIDKCSYSLSASALVRVDSFTRSIIRGLLLESMFWYHHILVYHYRCHMFPSVDNKVSQQAIYSYLQYSSHIVTDFKYLRITNFSPNVFS